MDWRIVITFKRPPEEWDFRPAKSGKAWWRRAETLAQARKLADALANQNIHGVIKKIDALQKSPTKPGAHKLRSSQAQRPQRYPFPDALAEAARLDGHYRPDDHFRS